MTTIFEMEIQGATTLTFPITPEFFPRKAPTWKRDGKQEFVVESVPVRGWFSENDDQVLENLIEQLRDLAENGSFLNFIFRRVGGPEVLRINAATMHDLEEVRSDGSRANHVEFTFRIEEERGGSFSSLVRFSSQETTTKSRREDGSSRTVVQKVVSATGALGNLSAARSFVLARKPTGNILTETIVEVEFDGTVTGTWNVDESKDDPTIGTILRWDETATKIPGLVGTNWFRTPDVPFPIRGGQGESSFVVSGTIKVFDKANLPTALVLTNHFILQAIGETQTFIEDLSIDSPKAVEFDVDDPAVGTVFLITYSFTITFGETRAVPFPASVNADLAVRFNAFQQSPESGASGGSTVGGNVQFMGIQPSG